MERRYTRFFVVIYGVLSAATTIAQTADRPDVHVGDRWSWQHTNALVNERDYTVLEDVVEIAPDEIRTRDRIKGKSGDGLGSYSLDWNPIDVNTARYDPLLREYVFPLKVGSTWTASADKMLFKNGKHGKFEIKGEVLAYEKVTVPAGVFDAYKISLHMDAVSIDEDANIGNTVETIWYAPSVKRYVRFESAFSRDGRVRSKDLNELLEYNLR